MSRLQQLVGLFVNKASQRSLSGHFRALCSSQPVRTTFEENGGGHPQEPFDPVRESFSLLIPPNEYRERQIKLVQMVEDHVQSANRSSLLLIPGAQRFFQADTKIPLIHFKQNSEFIYFTGLNNQEAANCVLAILGGAGDPMKSILFIPYLNDHQILWEGPGIMSADNLKRLEAICDSVADIKLMECLIEESRAKRQIFVTKCGLYSQTKNGSNGGSGKVIVAKGQEVDNGSDNGTKSVVAHLSPFIDELRLIKSTNEIKAMKRTCTIGATAMKSTMKWTETQTAVNYDNLNIPLINEAQIGAKFDYESRVNGACKVAFPSVCAGGHRSTIIHYGANNKFVSPEDWVLMDAGCEDIEGYNSDITRSWQIDGNLTQGKLHFALYQALCEVHQELIITLKETLPSLDNLFHVMCHLLGKVLIEFNVIPKSSSPAEAAKIAYRYCPHHVSHYLGLDVHDTPTIARNIPLRPGMVFTVEPGLYFRSKDDVKKEFKGIGLRVEDDLLIDENGSLVVLTQNCPQIMRDA